MEDTKTKLRKLTLGATQKFKTTTVIVEGSPFEVRQPSLKQRSALRKKCTVVTDGGIEFNLFEFLIWAVIFHTYVPGTEELVFSEEDYEALVSMPAGGWFDELSEAASKLFNVGSEDAKKPSSKAPKVSLSM